MTYSKLWWSVVNLNQNKAWFNKTNPIPRNGIFVSDCDIINCSIELLYANVYYVHN